MTIRTYVFLVFVLSLHNLHKHGPFAHANVSTLGEPAGMLYPWVIWRFPVLQSTATKETASAICIACKIKKIQTPAQSQLPSELSATKYPPNPQTWYVNYNGDQLHSDPHIYFYINVWFLLVHNSMLLLTVNKAFWFWFCVHAIVYQAYVYILNSIFFSNIVRLLLNLRQKVLKIAHNL